jgi:nucleoside-diphosphate-sugar epimerase
MKKALLTGVTGFVGSHLAEGLLQQDWEVHCLLRAASHRERLPKIVAEKALFYDLAEDNNNIEEIMQQVKPDVVFHLASLFLAEHKTADIAPMLASNITFGTQLVDAMVKNGIYCLINTGTAWQHYHDDLYNPVCLYAATKEAFSAILKFYEETAHLKVITLKLFDTYGPNDFRAKLFSLLRKAADHDDVLMMSPGKQYLDMVHIKDVINAYTIAAEHLLKNHAQYFKDYAVSSGKLYQLKEFVEIYERISGKALPIQWGGREYRVREVMQPWQKGTVLPGWSPKISLEKGIRDVLGL